MTEAVQVALIVAAGPTLLGLIQHFHADRKLNHITWLTNSTLSAANKRIDELEQIVKKLTGE